MLIVNGCYSHFVIDENTAKNVLKQKGISKVMLKDETEINFIDKENYLVSVDWDNLTYGDINGNEHKVLFNDVMKWYEYQFDGGKTFFSILWIGFSIILLALLTGTRLWGG
jgi:hypothetical protein